MSTDQSDFKNTIKEWLKLHKLSYGWLAEQCGVSEITIRNWMSQRHIPTLKRQMLHKLMAQLPGKAEPGSANSTTAIRVNAGFTLNIELGADIYNRLLTRAENEGKSVEELVTANIERLANEPGTVPMRSFKVILPPEKTE